MWFVLPALLGVAAVVVACLPPAYPDVAAPRLRPANRSWIATALPMTLVAGGVVIAAIVVG